MNTATDYWIGVDGGGTSTRVLLANGQGEVLTQAQAGASALGQGVPQAWHHILAATRLAFSQLGRPTPPWSHCALAAGLSGANHEPWRAQFMAANPGFTRLILDSDATTALLAAHGGRPGVLLVAGTGSVGEVLRRDGTRLQAGGWGFPVGDEGSGAWLGLRAMAHAQHALDGRLHGGTLADLVLRHCGQTRPTLLAWCTNAGQNAYAQLAPLVFESASTDACAQALLGEAARALECMADALDPTGQLPVAVLGSVGQGLQNRLRPDLLARCVQSPPMAAYGALALLHQPQENAP